MTCSAIGSHDVKPLFKVILKVLVVFLFVFFWFLLSGNSGNFRCPRSVETIDNRFNDRNQQPSVVMSDKRTIFLYYYKMNDPEKCFSLSV